MSFGYIALHCIGIVCTMFKKIQSVLHKPSHPANIGFFHKTSLALQSHNRNHHQILHFSFTNIHLVSNKTWVWPGRACDLVVGLWKWRRSTLTFKCVSSFCLTENNKFEQISPFPSISPPEHLNKFEQIGLLHLSYPPGLHCGRLQRHLRLWSRYVWRQGGSSPFFLYSSKYFDQVEESNKDYADTTDYNNDDDDSSADYLEEGPRKLNRAR